MNKPNKFVVHRKKWLRGGKSEPMLRNENGSMCCLGFLGKACGLTNYLLLERSTPASTYSGCWPTSLLEPDAKRHTLICNKIIQVNDCAGLSAKQREKELTELFKKAGIKIIFKD